MEIITRKQTFTEGRKTYFTGRPCRAGHLSPRYVCDANCIQCKVARQAIFNAANPEFQRKYKEQNRERIRTHHATYREKTRDSRQESDRRLYQVRRGAVKATAKAWYAADPLRERIKQTRRRARKMASGGRHTAADINTLLAKQRGLCDNCRVSLREGFHVDHVTPLVLGGSDGPENLALLCPKCNLAKGVAHPLVWAKRNGRLV